MDAYNRQRQRPVVVSPKSMLATASGHARASLLASPTHILATSEKPRAGSTGWSGRGGARAAVEFRSSMGDAAGAGTGDPARVGSGADSGRGVLQEPAAARWAITSDQPAPADAGGGCRRRHHDIALADAGGQAHSPSHCRNGGCHRAAPTSTSTSACANSCRARQGRHAHPVHCITKRRRCTTSSAQRNSGAPFRRVPEPFAARLAACTRGQQPSASTAPSRAQDPPEPGIDHPGCTGLPRPGAVGGAGAAGAREGRGALVPPCERCCATGGRGARVGTGGAVP